MSRRMVLIMVLGALAVFVGAASLYNSPRAVARRVARWQRTYEETLRGESVEALRNRILTSDYWSLAASSPLREAPVVKEFFRRLDSEEYGEILSELGDGVYLCGMFAGVERSIGYQGRPMIMDYDGVFVPVLKELRRRTSAPLRS